VTELEFGIGAVRRVYSDADLLVTGVPDDR
jgi:hypothetical protein